MHPAQKDPNSFRRYFSTDAGEREHGPALVTAVSSSFSAGQSVVASSPAALFLSAFSPAAAAAPTLEPDSEGAVVGGFTLGPIIAHGGFSTIRRATSATSGATVAVKIVPRQRERGAARRIAHEEAIWTSLSHEHILPLFACIHMPTADFFVTQLCPAGSLFDIMRGGVPTREDTGRMFRQIVRGLRYLHTEKRLVHRDIKLENVLVDEAGVCRIADFGMARGMDEEGEWSGLHQQHAEPEGLPIPMPTGGVHRAMSMAVPRSTAAHPLARRERNPSANTTTTEFQPGSLPYAAPELLGPPPLSTSISMTGKTKASALAGAGGPERKSNSAFVSHPHPRGSFSVSSTANDGAANGDVTATSIAAPTNPAPAQDIWALGVLLYALLMGRLPFMDSFEPRLVLKILGGTYVPPTNVNPRTLAVLRGCLAPRMQDRWAVERVDEAAWSVGGEDAHLHGSPVLSDASSSSGCSEHAPRPTMDRGRPGAAARRASERVERSGSRAPYGAAVAAGVRSPSRTRSSRRSESRPAMRSGSRSASSMRSESRDEDSQLSQSESRSRSRGGSLSGSRSRSRSAGPRTPVDSVPPLLGLSLQLGMLGMGYPSTGKGMAMGRATTAPVPEEGRESEAEDQSETGPGMEGGEAEGEAGGEGNGVLGGGMLLSPHALGMSEGDGRRSGSTPPVAWRGPGGGPGAGRSRSLSGTGAV
ncbi:kinase-like domain-containing protein [Mycena filopes]|nr:kinase-like domain-containing protein [Mycena filopes]